MTLLLASTVPSFAEIEAACGPAPVLALYGSQTLPAAFDSPDHAPPVWSIAMPQYCPLGARVGVHCPWRPPAGFAGHFRVWDSTGACQVMGTVGDGAAMIVLPTANGCRLRMEPAVLPPVT